MTAPTNPTSRERPRTGAGIRGATGEMILSRTRTLTVSFSLHRRFFIIHSLTTGSVFQKNDDVSFYRMTPQGEMRFAPTECANALGRSVKDNSTDWKTIALDYRNLRTVTVDVMVSQGELQWQTNLEEEYCLNSNGRLRYKINMHSDAYDVEIFTSFKDPRRRYLRALLDYVEWKGPSYEQLHEHFSQSTVTIKQEYDTYHHHHDYWEEEASIVHTHIQQRGPKTPGR